MSTFGKFSNTEKNLATVSNIEVTGSSNDPYNPSKLIVSKPTKEDFNEDEEEKQVNDVYI